MQCFHSFESSNSIVDNHESFLMQVCKWAIPGSSTPQHSPQGLFMIVKSS